MFICSPCLEENFVNFGMFQSYGKCEYCDKTATCYEIPSKRLERKIKEEKTDI